MASLLESGRPLPAVQPNGAAALRFGSKVFCGDSALDSLPSLPAAFGLCELSGLAVMRLNAFISSAIRLP
jgi:hypothetical protein